MPSFSFKDARLMVNSVNLSEFTRSVTFNVEAEELEDTAMGDDYRSRLGGLKTWSLEIEFNQDFASAAVDDTLWPLFGTNTSVSVRPTSDAISATNPEYSGTVLVSQVNPFGNAVGEVATASVTWPSAGPLSRSTS